MNEVNTVERPVMWGCDDLREWLTSQGFTCLVDSLSRDNGCNWYAYKRSKYQARECECNEGKKMQIVIRPFSYANGTQSWESAEVDVTGEVAGLWFKLSAYSVPHDELKARLQEIEVRLLDSWNALSPHNAGISVRCGSAINAAHWFRATTHTILENNHDHTTRSTALSILRETAHATSNQRPRTNGRGSGVLAALRDIRCGL